jgi:serine/threonine protein kinase
MDYIAGQSLVKMIAEKKLSCHRSLEIVHQIAQALEMAHKAGFLHRNIKHQICWSAIWSEKDRVRFRSINDIFDGIK